MLSFGKARLLAHLHTASGTCHLTDIKGTTITAPSAPVLVADSGGVNESTAGFQKPRIHSCSRRDHYSGRHHDNAEVLEGRIVRSNPSHGTINPVARSTRVREADIGDHRLASHMCKLVRLSFAD